MISTNIIILTLDEWAKYKPFNGVAIHGGLLRLPDVAIYLPNQRFKVIRTWYAGDFDRSKYETIND